MVSWDPYFPPATIIYLMFPVGIGSNSKVFNYFSLHTHNLNLIKCFLLKYLIKSIHLYFHSHGFNMSLSPSNISFLPFQISLVKILYYFTITFPKFHHGEKALGDLGLYFSSLIWHLWALLWQTWVHSSLSPQHLE